MSQKPYPDFPLTLHPTGRWCKKIDGKLVYFGRDADAALARYREYSSEHRLTRQGGATLQYAMNAFLTFKEGQVAEGTLAPRSYQDYVDTAKRVKEHLDISRPLASYGPDDFQLLRTRLTERREKKGAGKRIIRLGRGPVALNGDLRRLRIMLKYAYDERLIDKPVWGGQSLKAIPPRVIRKTRKAKLFTREEILALLKHAGPTLRAMILLGINCGYGNDDVARLMPEHCKPAEGVDDTAKVACLPRNKTGAPRASYFWPETAEAIEKAGGLPFKTKTGKPWSTEQKTVSKAFRKVLLRAGLDGQCFYALRHTFQTVADEAPFTKDHVVKAIMGHFDPTMSSHYRERVKPGQLRYVSEYVRAWLFGLEEPALSVK